MVLYLRKKLKGHVTPFSQEATHVLQNFLFCSSLYSAYSGRKVSGTEQKEPYDNPEER